MSSEDKLTSGDSEYQEYLDFKEQKKNQTSRRENIPEREEAQGVVCLPNSRWCLTKVMKMSFRWVLS